MWCTSLSGEKCLIRVSTGMKITALHYATFNSNIHASVDLPTSRAQNNFFFGSAKDPKRKRGARAPITGTGNEKRRPFEVAKPK